MCTAGRWARTVTGENSGDCLEMARARFFLSNKPPEKGGLLIASANSFFGMRGAIRGGYCGERFGPAGLEIRFDG